MAGSHSIDRLRTDTRLCESLWLVGRVNLAEAAGGGPAFHHAEKEVTVPSWEQILLDGTLSLMIVYGATLIFCRSP